MLEAVPNEDDRHILATLNKKQRVAFVYHEPDRNLIDVVGFFREITPQGEIVVAGEQERHCDGADYVRNYNLKYVYSVSNLSDYKFVSRYDSLRLTDEKR